MINDIRIGLSKSSDKILSESINNLSKKANKSLTENTGKGSSNKTDKSHTDSSGKKADKTTHSATLSISSTDQNSARETCDSETPKNTS